MNLLETRKLLICASIVSLAACGGGGGGGTPSVPVDVPAGSAALAWSAPSDSRIRGYRIYYGTVSGNYLQSKGAGIDSGSQTMYVVSSLQPGQTYYFAVTSYDTNLNESDYSNEVSKSVN